MLRAMGMKEKMKLGPRRTPVLAALARSKRLRGTVADPFRWAEVRRLERAMIPEYERAVDRLAERLTAGNLDEAVAIASLPDQVRGYEHLKLPAARPTAPSWPTASPRPLTAFAERLDGLPRLPGEFVERRLGQRVMGQLTRARAVRRAAPTMPASFSSAAGTISVSTSM